MGYVVKIIRDVANSKDDVYVDGVLTLSSPWFPDFTSPYVSVNADFEFYSMSNLVELNYIGAVETDVKNYQFDLSNLFDTVVIPETLSFECWNSTYTTSLFLVIKNQFGAYSSLIETNMTFNQTTAIATGLTYVSAPASSTCDLTSLTPEFDEIDLQVATLHAKMDSLHQKVDYLVTALGQVYTLEQSLATKEDLLPLATQYDTNNFIEDNRVILHQLLLETATKDDISVLAHYDVTNITLPSLNGNGTEFKDGSSVVLFGRETVYTVERSYMSLYSDNAYTVHYDLVSVDGYKCSVPEALLTKHVAAV